jgi:tRNA nucleotidyltransferase (CCA-adding enzyme)
LWVAATGSTSWRTLYYTCLGGQCQGNHDALRGAIFFFETVSSEIGQGFLCYNIGMGRNYSELLEKSLDGGRLELLHLLAYQAVLLRMPLYLVGGVVRDILLGLEVKDFDLVVEGSSAEFAEFLVRKFGGRILVHSKFMTATWVISESTFNRLNFPILHFSEADFSFDLVSARSEMYSQPGALPTVKRSNIDDDLRRRDFTINAMAFRLDGDQFGEMFDPLNGQKDLENKLIRVLYDKSFVDDPTRMFRGIRYAARYGFELEPETLKLINEESQAVLSQLSGERIRHEFDLIFEEENANTTLERLQDLNVIKAIDPVLQNAVVNWLSMLTDKPEEGFSDFLTPDILSFRQTLGWILYLVNLSKYEVERVAKRLTFPTLLTKSVIGASSIRRDMSSFKNWKPSQWTFYLDQFPLLSVYAIYLMHMELAFEDYFTIWRNVKPFTSGYTLQQRGLAPGPKYKEILTRLRAAWLDGEVTTEEEEVVLLKNLLKTEGVE